MRAGGFPGNPGGLVVSILKTAGVRAPAHQARGRGRALGVRRSEAAGARMVPPREGNEARGDGWRGVGVPHSTVEAGESSRRDPVEGRGHRQMDPLEGQMANTPRLDSVSTKRQRIAELARDAPEMVFTSLAHHIDMHVLRAAYAATRKDGAVGLDGQTAADYAVHLEANLQSLLDRFKSGQYVAPPVRRVHIPKGDGRKGHRWLPIHRSSAISFPLAVEPVHATGQGSARSAPLLRLITSSSVARSIRMSAMSLWNIATSQG